MRVLSYPSILRKQVSDLRPSVRVTTVKESANQKNKVIINKSLEPSF